MSFLNTGPGKRYLSASNAAAVDTTRRIAELARPATDRAADRYQGEMAKISADFQRRRKTKGRD